MEERNQKDMALTEVEINLLMQAEKWLNYSTATGAVSLEEVMRKDAGEHFSTMLSEKDMLIPSFGMNNIPKANVLLVLGTNPRVVAYAAEIVLRHRDKYGYMPELVTAGDGCGTFKQRKAMAKCFVNAMLQLGFDEDWVTCNHIKIAGNRDYVEEITEKLAGIFCRNKQKVLVVMNDNLLAVQELSANILTADFIFFEMPQVKYEERVFNAELFSEDTFAVDTLIAKAIEVQLSRGSRIPLSIEKKFSRPRKSFLRKLVLMGYAGGMTKYAMAKFLNLSEKKVAELRVERLSQLHSQSAEDFDMSRFIKKVKKDLKEKGLKI